MAIVFISPKTRQRAFFWGIALALLLFLIIVFVITLLPELSSKPPAAALQSATYKPAVVIDFSTIDSPEVAALQPFVTTQAEFTYTGSDKSGKQIAGSIAADNQSDAENLLEASGYTISSIQEMGVGRSVPFVAY